MQWLCLFCMLRLNNVWFVWCRTRCWLQDLDGRGMPWEIFRESGLRLWRYPVCLCLLSLRRKRKSQGLRLIGGGSSLPALCSPQCVLYLNDSCSYYSVRLNFVSKSLLATLEPGSFCPKETKFWKFLARHILYPLWFWCF